MDRRTFLRRTSLALAGGLIVGDQALELFDRLTHVRKSFPSAEIGWQGKPVYFDMPYEAGGAMIPDGGYESILTINPQMVWTGPGSVNWQSLGLDPKLERLCLTQGQKTGWVDTYG